MRDGSGVRYIPYNAAAQISQSAAAPVYSLWTSLLGSGIVGGYLLSGELVGERMASVLKDPELVKNTAGTWSDQFHGFFYDWRQLERWHISKDTLPAQSKVLFKEDSFYEHYYEEIILVSLAVILFISFFWNRRLKMEIDNRIKTEQQLQVSENRFRTLSETTSEGIAITRNGAVIRDLTERKRSEEEIKTLQGLLPICSIRKKIRDDKGSGT
ncbi:hypothetical protein [uncultured Desulfobacter sp.]|uniref:hypothetical protein n=1 Tax=uncultured Desulfobacter sp. TaxID=240139 RepID=UPI0029F5329F|nr:hypothetical protein [uncultured Desulfobacter sp.]